jgi:glycosyltransferase involved in cell wall biosynthesis
MNEIKCTVIIPCYNQEELVIKAIESIPKRNDIEVIVIDDGSEDNTWANLMNYRNAHSDYLNLILLYNEVNKGVAYTVNRGYSYARGEYVVLLGSDDYFYTDKFEKAMKLLDGTDLVYFNLKINNGNVLKVTSDSKTFYCGSVKFMRKDFIGNTRCPEDKRAGEDWYFYQELLKKNPTEKFTDITVKHYNFPREGSLINLASKGLLK